MNIITFFIYAKVMAYFNYHAKAKNKIKEGKLVDFQILDRYNKISPALVLYFIDDRPMPIREYRWEEYFTLIEKYNKKLLSCK